MNISIGENIKKMRNQKGVTQERLAEGLGVTPQAISRWESGAGYPAIEYLPDLAGFFGISVDELLGVKLSEREARREEIYATINHIEDCGYNPTAIDLLREAHAEFPGDRKISLSLARALCSVMWEEEPDRTLLREAEKMLRDLIRQADDNDFRFACVKELAILYKEAWKDETGYDEVVKMLPGIDSCREVFITDCFNGAVQKQEEVRDCVRALARKTVNILRDYVAYSLPNEEKDWNYKIDSLKRLIDFTGWVSEWTGGENGEETDAAVAVLYRYLSTYYVAQGKKDETRDSLTDMFSYVERICKRPSANDKPHNVAWYFLPYLNSDRYDPVRGEEWFAALRKQLEELAAK